VANESVDLSTDELDVVTSNFDPDSAVELLQSCDFGLEPTDPVFQAAVVMLCPGAIPASFGYHQIDFYREVKARLLRDWIWIPSAPNKVIRAAWRRDNGRGHVALLLDAMVAAGRFGDEETQIRRTWSGSYHTESTRPSSESQRSRVLSHLKTVASASAADVSVHLTAIGPPVTRSAVQSILSRLHKASEVVNVHGIWRASI
jgi:hypothetical protein